MREALTLVVAAISFAGCVRDPVFACADDAECPHRDDVCVDGACLASSSVQCAADAPSFAVTLTSSGVALCSGDVTAVGDDGSQHALAAGDVDGKCAFVASGLTGHFIVHALSFGRDAAVGDVTVHAPTPGQCTTTLALDVTTKPGACFASTGCSGGRVCTVDAANETSSCTLAGASSRALGRGCVQPSDCATDLCLGGECSTLCASDADCKKYQLCAPSTALLGESACVVKTDLPEEPCADDADCADTDRVCYQVVVGALECGLPTTGDAALGDPCSAIDETQTCIDGLCDNDQNAGRCTRSCKTSAECDSPDAGPEAQSLCTSIAVEGVSGNVCFQPCRRLSQCADSADRTCRARLAENGGERIDFACDGNKGTIAVGDERDGNDSASCTTNFNAPVVDAGVGNTAFTCSAPCETVADCPLSSAGAAAKRCATNGEVVVVLPISHQTQAVSACQY